MEIKKLREILESSGIPFAYRRWKKPHGLPFGCFFLDRTNGFSADGITYSHTSRYEIELYTEDKQPDKESALESAFTAAGIFWNKTSETYIEKEQMQFTTYEIEV